MDREKAETYALLANVAAKLFLALLTGIVFIAVTAKLILDPQWPIAVVETVLVHTVYRVFEHYFPTT